MNRQPPSSNRDPYHKATHQALIGEHEPLVGAPPDPSKLNSVMFHNPFLVKGNLSYILITIFPNFLWETAWSPRYGHLLVSSFKESLISWVMLRIRVSHNSDPCYRATQGSTAPRSPRYTCEALPSGLPAGKRSAPQTPSAPWDAFALESLAESCGRQAGWLDHCLFILDLQL